MSSEGDLQEDATHGGPSDEAMDEEPLVRSTLRDVQLDRAVDVVLHSKQPTPPASGELALRKVYLRVRASVLERLRPLVCTPKTSDGAYEVGDIAPLEAVAQAIEWAASGGEEERPARVLDEQWPRALGLMEAASWLGLPALLAASQQALSREVCLDNAVAVACAAERCNALPLLSRCFFLLKAYFCATEDDERPALRSPDSTPPSLLRNAIAQGEGVAIAHSAWRSVQASCACRAAHLAISQPHYTLCTLTRHKSAEGGPSLFTLKSEHDGKLLLVGRQRHLDSEYLIFACPHDSLRDAGELT